MCNYTLNAAFPFFFLKEVCVAAQTLNPAENGCIAQGGPEISWTHSDATDDSTLTNQWSLSPNRPRHKRLQVDYSDFSSQCFIWDVNSHQWKVTKCIYSSQVCESIFEVFAPQPDEQFIKYNRLI